MRILIDGDGCPVVGLALKAAAQRGIPVTLVCDQAHAFSDGGMEVIRVLKGADSADFALVNRAGPGDVVVTQDYGLAAMCLAKKALAIRQDGLVYTGENMDGLLAQRHEAKKIRRGGGRLKGPKKRTPDQDKQFWEAFTRLLAICAGGEERDSKGL